MLLPVLFWLSLLTVGYTFVGYPLLLRGLNGLFRRGSVRAEREDTGEGVAVGPLPWPSLSIILVVRNEAGRIGGRLDNLVSCHYEGAVEIIVVVTGEEDEDEDENGTAGVVREWQLRRGADEWPVLLVEEGEVPSKAGGLNAGVAVATGEVLVFVDARQRFDGGALEGLVAPLVADAAATVAGVSGCLEIEPSEEGAASGMDAYWRFEKWIRREEANWYAVIGCTGAIYALRRECYRPIPEDTILDDVVIPMQAVVAGGKRVLFAGAALAFDPQALHPEKEAVRKTRTLAGNFQMLFRYPGWLLPFRNRCWWQLLSHKYLRLAGPLCLAVCLLTCLLLALDDAFYRILFSGMVTCYTLAIAGLVFPKVGSPLLTIPAGFVFLQWQVVRGLVYYLSRRGNGGAW